MKIKYLLLILLAFPPFALSQVNVGGPVTAVENGFADGAVVTIGKKTDAKSAATDATSASLIAVLKQISASIQSLADGAYVSGVITPGSAMTGTTSTQVIAGTTSNYLYITSCSLSNGHGSVSTYMTLQDGSGGTALWSGLVPFGGGREVQFPVPLKVPTVGNGLYIVNVTTGSSTTASCSGYRSTTSY